MGIHFQEIPYDRTRTSQYGFGGGTKEVILQFSNGHRYEFPLEGLAAYILEPANFGWDAPYLPPQDFIEDMCQGGTVTIKTVLSKGISVPFPNPRAEIRSFGYVRPQKIAEGIQADWAAEMASRFFAPRLEDVGNVWRLVDTQGGDRNLNKNTLPTAMFGALPEAFLENFRTLLDTAQKGDNQLILPQREYSIPPESLNTNQTRSYFYADSGERKGPSDRIFSCRGNHLQESRVIAGAAGDVSHESQVEALTVLNDQERLKTIRGMGIAEGVGKHPSIWQGITRAYSSPSTTVGATVALPPDVSDALGVLQQHYGDMPQLAALRQAIAGREQAQAEAPQFYVKGPVVIEPENSDPQAGAEQARGRQK